MDVEGHTDLVSSETVSNEAFDKTVVDEVHTEAINVVTLENVEVEGAEREVWGNKCQFMLSCIGYAVGLGNVWRFPYLCYKNGGGTFLIPYGIMLLIEGIPLFFLELSLGQHRRQGAYGSFYSIHPALAGIGLATLFCNFFVGLYYNVIIGWTLLYLFESMQSKLPWDGYVCDSEKIAGNCSGVATEDYWFHESLHASESIDEIGGLQWKLVLCLLGAWTIIMLAELKGIQSVGYVVYVTAIFPYIVLVTLFFRGVTLEGAGKGIEFYLTPDFSRLGDSGIWLDAASQILYSLSPGFGTLIAYGSYNKKDNDTLKDTLIVCCINCGTSVFAGFAIFAILGSMAHVRGVPVDQVVKQGPGLAFEAYPEAVLDIPGSVFWSIAFFLMLFMLGIDSMFGTCEGIIAVMEDLGYTFKRKELNTITYCVISCLCGLLFCTRAGVYIFELFDQYSANIPLMCIVLTELIGISWCYGVDTFIVDVETMIGRKLSSWWWYAWKWITPFVLTFILIWSIISELITPRTYNTPSGPAAFPGWAILCGWILILSSVLWIPGVAFYNRKEIRWSLWKAITTCSPKSVLAECTRSKQALSTDLETDNEESSA
eukprot:m.145189 g.145189  ORF g.145189 m.145189 type:complete len:599 (+) comp30426_c0_seq1:273-2069(+)